MKRKPTPLYEDDSGHRRRKAKTLEARENQLIALAYDLVEQRILDGTATAQETTHFLRMGSSKERREAEMDRMEIELKAAKKEAIEASRRIEALYEDAIDAVKGYRSPNVLNKCEVFEEE